MSPTPDEHHHSSLLDVFVCLHEVCLDTTTTIIWIVAIGTASLATILYPLLR